jgi:hypothetical protein
MLSPCHIPGGSDLQRTMVTFCADPVFWPVPPAQQNLLANASPGLDLTLWLSTLRGFLCFVVSLSVNVSTEGHVCSSGFCLLDFLFFSFFSPG